MTNDTTRSWLETRQGLLTASDTLFILKEFNPQLKDKLASIETYKRTRYQLYNEKLMEPESYIRYNSEVSNSAMVEGKIREIEVAERTKTDLDLTLEANGENVIIHGDAKLKIGATPDFYITSFDLIKLNSINDFDPDFPLEGRGILECKLTGNLRADSITAYTFQVQQQLLCTGLNWAIIGVAVKSSRETGAEIAEMHYFFIKKNDNLQLAIIDASVNFWKWFEDVRNEREVAPQPSFENSQDVILARTLKVKAKERKEALEVKDRELIQILSEYRKLEEKAERYKELGKILNEKLKEKGLDDGETTGSIFIKNGKKSFNLQIKYSLPTLYTKEDKTKAEEEALKISLGEIKTKGKRYIAIEQIQMAQSQSI